MESENNIKKDIFIHNQKLTTFYCRFRTTEKLLELRIQRMYEVANKLESKSVESDSSSNDQFLNTRRYNPQKIEIVKERNKK